jgi:uncharacterized protein YqeY
MLLIEQLRSDLNKALRAGDQLGAETLRMVLASVHNFEIEKRTKGIAGELTDNDVIGVLQKEAKKRKEAMEIYGKAERTDLENKEKKELEIISLYLPPQMDEKEIKDIVKQTIQEVGEEQFGKIMQVSMQKISGRAEAKLVSEIIKEEMGEKND